MPLPTDWYSKLMLTVIAVCLALLLAQQYRGDAAATGAVADRFRLTPLPMIRMLLRFDSETGQTSKAMFPDLKVWTPVADSLADILDEPAAELDEAPALDATAPEATEPALEEPPAPATP